MPLTRGEKLGPYEIVSPIGAGGMGVVYQATDTRLDRPVAIKVLPEDVSGDPVALDRFTREARAVSNLNHPNICALYDIGEERGRRFLVLELLEGESFRERLRAGPLSPAELVDVASQIADALQAAHEKGIIHRDLKPANVFLTSSGRVKILDFGLAARSAQDAAGDATTRTMLTHPGMFTGTPAYAAPEQTQGGRVDERSDLFSFGLVLYEMATGTLPFPGACLGQMLAAADVELKPPSKVRVGLPRPLDGIILKLLERDPTLRFESAREFRDALQRIRSGISLTRRRLSLWGFASASVIVLGLAVAARLILSRPPASIEYTRLTNFQDSAHSATVSKDGKMLAFVRGPLTFLGGPSQIYVKILPDGQPVALTHDATNKMGPVFSPDGAHVVYNTGEWSTFSVPVSGGEPVLFMRNAAGVRWISPRKMLYSAIKEGYHMGLVTATEGRAEERPIYFPPSSEGMAHFSKLSPDGASVLAVEMLSGIWQPCRLVPFDGSSTGVTVGPRDAPCTAADWSPDGRWMYFIAERDGESHLWRQRYPNGPAERVTSGPDQEWGVTADSDGRSLITAVGNMQSTVWYHDEAGDRPISVEGYAYRPLMSPDGSRVFYLVRRGAKGATWIGELWAAELSTGRREQVPTGVLVQNYHISWDGKYVVFDSFDESGRSKIWTGPIDRSQVIRRLTPDGDVEEQRPFFGASGDIYFNHRYLGERSFYRMKRDGSERVKIRSGRDTYLVNVSPDEHWAAMWGGGNTGMPATLAPLDGSAPKPLCTCAVGPLFQDSPRISWSGDGKLVFINPGDTAVVGTTVLPWTELRVLPAGHALSPEEMRKLPGARTLQEISIAPGLTGATYAYIRQAEHSNLYRIRLP